MIELAHVSKHFGAVTALDDVSLRFALGRVHGLVGENGAGKSTASNILAGVTVPDEGAVRITGRSVYFRSPRDALTHGIVLISQELTLVPRRTVLENVLLGSMDAWHGIRQNRRMRRRYLELTELVGFDIPPDVRVDELRVADQQKVEILRAIAREAKLLLMDEPTAALGHDEAIVLFELIHRLRMSGTGIVYISHALDEVLGIADEVSVLRDGRLVRTAPTSSETSESLVRAMLGRSLELTFPTKQVVSADAEVMLSVDGLSRDGRFHDVSFDLRVGEIVGIAGLVGSGRTEVAEAIFGAAAPSRGKITVGGREVVPRHPRDGVHAGVGMVPEDRKRQGLHLMRTVAENISLSNRAAVSRLGIMSRARQRACAVRALGTLAEADIIDRRVETLSGGNQQKVLFGKWLFVNPRILIADEPTRGVDVGAKRAIYQLLSDVAAQGVGVLLISSELEEVLGLAHRVLVMRGGRLVAELVGEEATEDAVMRAAFGTSAARHSSQA